MPNSFHVRPATLDDVPALIHHRIAMFSDMRAPLDAPALAREFGAWLRSHMPTGTYRAWVAEIPDRTIVAGAGATVLAWPPGPRYMGDRLAFVYNMYVEPDYRRRGLARLVMSAVHAWCREGGVASMALNASEDGRPLYESLGYQLSPSPMMFLALAGTTGSPAEP